MTHGSLTLDPLLPWPWLLALAAITAVALALAVWRRLTGWSLRAAALAVLLAALANPSWLQEQRQPLPGIALVVIDDTSSQTIAPRPEQTEATLAAITKAIDGLAVPGAGEPPVEMRLVRVPDGTGSDAERGSLVLTELARAAAKVASDRIAGAIIVSDGRIDDAGLLGEFPAPVHHLVTGRSDEWDRRLVIETAPAYAIVGESIELGLRIETLGNVPADLRPIVPVFLSIDGAEPIPFTVQTGEKVSIEVKLNHAGPNVVQLVIPDAEGELTDLNNQAVVSVNGIRDRLRVLLVSGEPYAGERTWRNLLKSDPAVDLVHFTILRPPTKQDGVPVFELSLIAFPTRELFLEKIDEFDLIILDRYRDRDVLANPYLENIVRYVEDGGALLVASGPAFAGAESLYRSPLGEIFPAAPTGQVIEQGYVPQISELGQRHPVTAGLDEFAPNPQREDGSPGWGRWFRLVESVPLSGQTLMTALDDRALLVLDRIGAGRVAQLGSDQAWLWSRGYEGGGPQLELLRRLAHWLMKEPELEEETLSVAVNGGEITLTRRSLGDAPQGIEATLPDGSVQVLQLSEVGPGHWQAILPAQANGLYRFSDGELEAIAAVGPAVPKEFENPISTAELLAPLTGLTRGGSFSVETGGVPDLRMVREGRASAGRNWMGLAERNAYSVTDLRQIPLAPAWLMLMLAGLLSLLAWRVGAR